MGQDPPPRRHVNAVLADSPAGVRLVLENSAGGGDTLGGTIEDLATILDGGNRPGRPARLLPRYGAPVGRRLRHLDCGWRDRLLDRFDELIGLDRLALIHLNDSRSPLGCRNDRHEHIGAGKIGPEGLAALLRDPRLARRTAFVMETPGVDEGFDATNMRRAWLLYGGAKTLPVLPPRAFRTSRRSTRAGIRRAAVQLPAASGHGEGPGGQYPGLRSGM